MAEIKSAIIPTDRSVYTDAPKIWSELSAKEQAEYGGGTINSMGAAYTTLTAWEAAAQAISTSLGHQYTAVVFSFGSQGLIDSPQLAGITATATNFLRVTAHPDYAHKGVWDANNSTVKLNTTNNHGIYVTVPYSIVENLQITGTARQTAIQIETGDWCRIANCFVRGFTPVDARSALRIFSGSSHVIERCIVAHAYANSGAITSAGAGSTIQFCLAYGISGTYDITFTSTAGTNILRHCIAYNNTNQTTSGNFRIAGSTATADYLVSADTTANIATNFKAKFDFSTLFPNAASGDFRPAVSYTSAFGTTWGAGVVPWERVYHVDPGGSTYAGAIGNYTTLAAAEGASAAQAGGTDLVLRNEKVKFLCRNTNSGNDPTPVTLGAIWVTSQYCNLNVIVDPAHRHAGVWNDSKYKRVSVNNYQHKFTVHTPFTIVDGIQGDGSGHEYSVFQTNAGSVTLSNSIFKRGNWWGYSQVAVTGPNCLVYNCVAYDATSSNTAGFGSDYGSGGIRFINCTAYNNPKGGFNERSEHVITYTNCLAFGNGTADFVIGGANSVTSCISGDASLAAYTGTGNLWNQTALQIKFADVATRDLRIHYDSVAAGAGVALRTLGIDKAVTGHARKNYSIGAAEAPTARTYIVDTDAAQGHNVSLIAAHTVAVAAGQDLVANNEAVVFDCRATTGAADAYAEWTIPATWVCSPVNHLRITANPAHRHSGFWDATKYRIESNGTTWKNLMTVLPWYVVIDGLQVDGKNVSQVHFVSGASNGSGEVLTISNCIIKSCNKAIAMLYSDNARVFNNIIYDCTIGVEASSYPSNFYCFNNTALNCAEGFKIPTIASSLLVNNVAANCSTSGFSGAISGGTVSNNISTDNTAPGTGSSQKTLAELKFFSTIPGFEDLRIDFGSAAIGAGANLSTLFTTDNAGKVRTNWTVGANECKAYVKVVDPNGTVPATCDYTSLAAWESGVQTAHQPGEIAVALCKRTGAAKDTTRVEINGWRSGVMPRIIVDPAHRHNGVRGAGYVLDMSGTDNDALSIRVWNTSVEGLEITGVASATSSSGIKAGVWEKNFTTVRDCIIHNITGNRDAAGISMGFSGSRIVVLNTIILGISGCGVRAALASVTGLVANSTIYECNLSGDGYRGGITGSGLLIQNNYCGKNLNKDYAETVFASGSTNNVSSDNTALGTVKAVSKSAYADYFVNPAAGDFRLKGTSMNLWGISGADLSTYGYNTDIAGQTRSAPWDIGAFKYVELEVGGEAVVLTSPINNATAVQQPVVFQWQPFAGATVYNLQAATDAGFTNILLDITTPNTSYQAPQLTGTVHYWRVRAGN